MTNRLITKSTGLSWVIAILLSTSGLGVLLGFFLLLEFSPLFILLFNITIPLVVFFFTPLFRLAGIYDYLSPMLLAIPKGKKRYDIHNGTSFDYLLNMRGVKIGREWQNRLLYFYMEGFLEIIRRVEEGEIPEDIVIKGSSYFFSDNSAKRLGFSLEKASGFVTYNIITDYLDLTWMYSCAKGKLSFPSIKNVKAAVTTGKELSLHKVQILILQKRLQRYGT